MGDTARMAALKANRIERGQAVIRLAEQGLSYRQIAQRLGISHATAYRDALQAIARAKEANRDSAIEFVAREVERLEQIKIALLKAIQRDRNKPDYAAIDRYEKLLHRQAQLLGAYPSSAVQETGNTININILGYVNAAGAGATANDQAMVIQAQGKRK